MGIALCNFIDPEKGFEDRKAQLHHQIFQIPHQVPVYPIKGVEEEAATTSLVTIRGAGSVVTAFCDHEKEPDLDSHFQCQPCHTAEILDFVAAATTEAETPEATTTDSESFSE